MKTIKFILLLVIPLFAAEIPLKTPVIVTNKVKVSWDRNKEPDISGYKVYTTIGIIKQEQVVKDTFIVIDCSLIMLKNMSRAFFYVTAYDSSENVSTHSDTVNLVVSKISNYLFGDMNFDGKVNVLDAALFWSSGVFGSDLGMTRYNPMLDINMDGHINTVDHMAYLLNHGISLEDY